MSKPDPTDIRKRVDKIRQDIANVHEDLIQSDGVFWIFDIQALEVQISPNGNEVRLDIKLGRSENA